MPEARKKRESFSQLREQLGANPSPTRGRRWPHVVGSDEGSGEVPTQSQHPSSDLAKARLPSPVNGRRKNLPIFQAIPAYILIIQPTKQPHASACGSAAPALTLGPERTWRNGRRSRLQLECPRGNPRRRTAQIRGTLKASGPSQSRAKPGSREGVETRRGAPKAARPRRRDSPDHERPFFKRGGGESRSGKKICFSQGSAGSSPAVRTRGRPSFSHPWEKVAPRSGVG